MAELKTKPNKASVLKFINSVEHQKRREDALTLLDVMSEVTGEKPMMWGNSIVGFGKMHYKYATGREGDWLRTGFSPRKANMTLYIMNGFTEYETLLKKLGKYKASVSCLYVNKLEDIDMEVLKKMIHHSYFEAKYSGETD
ncbi:DUF1801 domain-containing protein [Aliikangiella coralliicola]|uniref:DUF1801 domain-containing protein n=1 Tax=Aliikangiella coralliicola TaxID=2592383 RepID=A0A545UI94_9GAMM|nr:DUF1801 domain-containing protein [Aliikangiella coralliicola]TQV89182.1 DUF1801 domain-containing protein [Aliikangiella coralliicola]